MHNSYRFLMMAGTIILGVMLLSLFVYVFRMGAKANQNIDAIQMEKQVIASNARFEKYNKNDNTISDMITLINLVYNYNKAADFQPSDCVKLTIKAGGVAGSLNLIVDSTSKNLAKNQIIYFNIGGKSLSVYDLANSDNTVLSGSILVNNDTFLKTYYGVDSDNKPRTIYKYVFNSQYFEYDEKTGLVNNIVIYAQINDLWTSLGLP